MISKDSGLGVMIMGLTLDGRPAHEKNASVEGVSIDEQPEETQGRRCWSHCARTQVIHQERLIDARLNEVDQKEGDDHKIGRRLTQVLVPEHTSDDEDIRRQSQQLTCLKNTVDETRWPVVLGRNGSVVDGHSSRSMSSK